MDGQGDYNRWTKEGLINRVQQLEKELEKYRRTGKARELEPKISKSLEAPSDTAASGQECTAVGAGDAPPQQPQEQLSPPAKKRKKKAGVDPSRYSTRYVALKLAYLGKNYSGFEFQANGELPAVEEELWKALVKTCLIFPENPDVVDFSICEYSKCGRTDRGVSAFGQVIGLRLRSNRPVAGAARTKPRPKADLDCDPALEEGGSEQAENEAPGPSVEDQDEHGTPYPVADEIHYCKVLNRILPPDIRILAWCPTPPPGFSARYSCRERQYRYFFTQPAFSPTPTRLEAGNSTNETGLKPGWLDIDAMRAAAAHFEGVHDFRNFCKVDASKQITNFTRRIFQSEIVEVPELASALPYLRRSEFRPADDGDSETPALLPKVYYLHIRGSAFLWHQIRHMVAVLFLVGQRRELPSIVPQLLDVERYPSSPVYMMASDVPLVLWDCLFGKTAERPAEMDEAGEDGLEWVYAGEDGDSLDMHGARGLMDVLWENWRDAKLDELLANRLLERVAGLVDPEKAVLQPASKAAQAVRVFTGGAKPKSANAYVPISKRPLTATFQAVNDRWAQQRGFASSAVMHETENWRSVIKAARQNRGRNDETQSGGGEVH